MYDITTKTVCILGFAIKVPVGRTWYAKDSMGMYVPVLDTAYFEKQYSGRWVPAFGKNAEGKPIRLGDRWVPAGEYLVEGIRMLCKDAKRILKGDWYASL